MSDKPTINPKGRFKLEYRGAECLNCGKPLEMTDKFCSNCSQANSTKKLSLKDFFDEFFSSLISYDSKLLKTLSTMLIRPGKITRDFINGKRASYTNPFRFLLSLSIVYFLMINYGGNYESFDKYGGEDEETIITKLNNWDISFDSDDNQVVKGQFDSISQGQGIKNFIEKAERQDSLILLNPKQYFASIPDSSFTDRMGQKQEFFKTLIRKDTIFDFEDVNSKYGIVNTMENRFAFNSANGVLRFIKQPGTFLSTMISKLPFAIFFFLPAFALFIWLAYIRKKYSYTDHLIFSFHNTSLFFILLIISYLIDWIFNISINWIFLIVFCVYLFISMYRFYQQGFFKTIIKYLFLNTIFFILATFSMIALFAGNIFTF